MNSPKIDYNGWLGLLTVTLCGSVCETKNLHPSRMLRAPRTEPPPIAGRARPSP